MTAKCFVDTNILVYAHDASAGLKHDRARELVEGLWQSRAGVVSTQVLQELSVNVRKNATKPLSPEATRELVSDYLAWHVVVNDGEAVLAALDLERRYRVSFWDALIIHAAQVGAVEVLYSEDLSDGQRYGDVRVVNPLNR
jgi:predicted nucleic acid-binding protein